MLINGGKYADKMTLLWCRNNTKKKKKRKKYDINKLDSSKIMFPGGAGSAGKLYM